MTATEVIENIEGEGYIKGISVLSVLSVSSVAK